MQDNTPQPTALSFTIMPQQLSLANKVEIVIFCLLLVATLVLTGLLKLYYRHLPEQPLNVLVRLQAYWNMLILPLNVALTLPVIWRLATGLPWPIWAAELVSFLIAVFTSHIAILIVAVAVLKLLLATHFSWVFSQNPVQLGHYVLGTTAVLAYAPNLAYNCWLLWVQGRSNTNTISFLVGSAENQVGINFNRAFVLVWLLIGLVMTGLVVFWIPVYLKKAHSADSIRNRDIYCTIYNVLHNKIPKLVLLGTAGNPNLKTVVKFLVINRTFC